MIFVKQGLIMSHIDFKILTGIVLRLLDLFFREQINFSEVTMNWSEEKRVRLVYMSHVIKTIGSISPNRFSNISSNINKVVIKHISYVPRIHMDNIMKYLLCSISYLTIFCVNDVIDGAPSLLYIIICSIEFMFIIKKNYCIIWPVTKFRN